MQNTQPKFKWHNEVIAWLNGENIEFKRPGYNDWAWTNITKNDNIPAFYEDWEYRIKPKEVVKYAGIYQMSEKHGTAMSDVEFDTANEVKEYMRVRKSLKDCVQKRTYLDGELIALELVKV